MKHVTKPALILFLIAAIVTALLSFVHALTLEPIAEQAKRTQENAMREVLPQATAFNEIMVLPVTSGNVTGVDVTGVFEGEANGKPVGFVVELAPEGYSGKISMVVGISTVDSVIAGMRVLKHTETPGLGALAVKEKFYSQYDNRPLRPITVVKSGAREDEIDAMTSATITTKAITDAVNDAIEYAKALEQMYVSADQEHIGGEAQ